MNILEKERTLEELKAKVTEINDESLMGPLLEEIEKYKQTSMTDLTPWDRVLLARHTKRPTAKDFIDYLFDDFMEFHGDRLYSDDHSIIGGIAFFKSIPVTIIAQQKGTNLEENLYRNFSMPHPEGYRKSLRLMKQAEKFKRPIITFIDTPGAYPGIGAEERGQGAAIATNLMEMSGLSVPVISIIIGEGGSGGALALGVANTVLMLENAVYSILSPEGYATILWKDSSLSDKAAEAMKLTSYDLEEFGIIDDIIKEPIGGAHFDPEQVFQNTSNALEKALNNLQILSSSDIRENRISKYRKMGFFQRFNYDNLGGFKK
jgi:acetyl-CoA carboxylase carboxyl transferase subunit alpha